MSDFFLYVTAVLLIIIGLTAVLYKRNLIKIVIAINIIAAGINLLYMALGYLPGGIAPIFTDAPALDDLIMVLPTPQALILVNIVIGFATTALMLTFVVLTYRNNGTIDIRKLKGIEEYE